MAIEIAGFPTKNGGSFHGYVSLPEGMSKKKCFAFYFFSDGHEVLHWGIDGIASGNFT